MLWDASKCFTARAKQLMAYLTKPSRNRAAQPAHSPKMKMRGRVHGHVGGGGNPRPKRRSFVPRYTEPSACDSGTGEPTPL
jgi:hypothetical protein